MTKWLKSHATRLELITALVISCFVAIGVSTVLIYQLTTSVVDSRIGETAERLEVITERIERQLDEMKKITLTQTNNNQVRVLPGDARDEALVREILEHQGKLPKRTN